MRKIKLYINVSLDGFISRKKDNVKLCESFIKQSAIDREFPLFYDSIDVLLIGGNTYRDILFTEFKWPFRYKVSYIVTKQSIKRNANEDIRFISENTINKIIELKNRKGKDIWLVGGGKLVSSLLSYNLIDEMTLLYIPVLLSDGIPLFSENYVESQWKLSECHFYENGVIKSTYKLSV